jgi:hypothetical protein
MMARGVTCPKCSEPLDERGLNRTDLNPCGGCGTPIAVQVFPAQFQRSRIDRGDQVIAEESACFYHPKKKAVRVCDACGRFICSLCEMELSSAIYCPGCIEAGRSKGTLEPLLNQRKRHDVIAFHTAFLPLVIPAFWFFTLFTAPAAVYLALKHWKDRDSLVETGRWRKTCAIILGTLQIAAWVVIVFLSIL